MTEKVCEDFVEPGKHPVFSYCHIPLLENLVFLIE